MSRRATTVGLTSLAVAALSLGVLVHGHSLFSNASTSVTRVQPEGSEVQDLTKSRNLALQPEAVRLLRRVGGQRFRSKTPQAVVMNGVLTTGSDRQEIQISRYQNARGERVQLVLASGAKLFSWEASTGARSSIETLGLSDRTILERLIFDSADQFILAQLRGAGYQVVIRNLRPDDAPDDYAGPLWDVVRVDDPESDEQKRPLSRWRLYHLNRSTGLIDKIVSEVEGQPIEANLSDWKERNGEKFPSTIVWTRRGQTLMTLNVTSVSLVAQ
jgi:hypothetical protein